MMMTTTKRKKVEEGAISKGMEEPLEARKGKDTDSSLTPPEDSSLADPSEASDLKNCKVINVHCFKSLSSGVFVMHQKLTDRAFPLWRSGNKSN